MVSFAPLLLRCFFLVHMSSNGVHERGSISVAAFTIVAVGPFLAATLVVAPCWLFLSFGE